MLHSKIKSWQSLLLLSISTCTYFHDSQPVSALPLGAPLPLPISFSIDRPESQREGLINTFPNHVYSLGPEGLDLATQGEIFQSAGSPLRASPNGTNIDRLLAALGNPLDPSDRGTFGLISGDNIFSLSYGMDSGNILQFSVDPNAIGLLGTDVNYESTLSPQGVCRTSAVPSNCFGDPGNEAAGDIFKSFIRPNFGSYILDHLAANHVLAPAAPGLNQLYRDESELGLQAPAVQNSALGPEEDNLDAFEEADAGNRFWGVDTNNDGEVDPNKFAFFNLDSTSPTLPTSGYEARDIFVSTEGTYNRYAQGSQLGLAAGDVIDALALSDIGGIRTGSSRPAPNGVLNAGDEALFSLAPGSTTLLNNPEYSPGDVFRTNFDGSFSRYATANQLGLQNTDNLDALDIKPTTHIRQDIDPITGQPVFDPITGQPVLIAFKHGQVDIVTGFGFATGIYRERGTVIFEQGYTDAFAFTLGGGARFQARGWRLLVATRNNPNPIVVANRLRASARSIGNGEFAAANASIAVAIAPNGNLFQNITANANAFVIPAGNRLRYAQAHATASKDIFFANWEVGSAFAFNYSFAGIALGADPVGVLTTKSMISIVQTTNIGGLETLWTLNLLATLDEAGQNAFTVDLITDHAALFGFDEIAIETAIRNGFIYDPLLEKWVWANANYSLTTSFFVNLQTWRLRTFVGAWAWAFYQPPRCNLGGGARFANVNPDTACEQPEIEPPSMPAPIEDPRLEDPLLVAVPEPNSSTSLLIFMAIMFGFYGWSKGSTNQVHNAKH